LKENTFNACVKLKCYIFTAFMHGETYSDTSKTPHDAAHCFVVKGSQVRISSQNTAILTEISCGIPQSLQINMKTIP